MKKFFQKQWLHNRQMLFVIGTIVVLLAAWVQSALGLDYVLRITPILLTIIACVMVGFWDAPVKAKLRASAVVVIGGLLIEIIGVKTGYIFGDYSYGSILGLSVLGAPITIGIMWLMVSLSAWHIVLLNKRPLWQRFLLGGLLVVMFDLILEQFATAYGLWSWQGGTVPFYNYLSWFVISIVWFFVFQKFTPKSLPSLYIISILPLMAVFFWCMLAIV